MLKKYFSTSITKKQSSDTGMAMILILLIIAVLTENDIYILISIPALIMNMTFPTFYYPIAVVWLGLSHLVGTFLSKIILSLVFILMVIPMSFIRKLLGRDTLLLKEFKKSSKSVMKIREHNYSSLDIEKPY